MSKPEIDERVSTCCGPPQIRHARPITAALPLNCDTVEADWIGGLESPRVFPLAAIVDVVGGTKGR